MKWTDIAEHQIQKAQSEGVLDDLKGSGKPLAKSGADTVEGAGMRIMAEAGVVPREIELKKAVDAQCAVLKATTDADARKREMAKLADLQLRLSIEQEARRKYYSTG